MLGRNRGAAFGLFAGAVLCAFGACAQTPVPGGVSGQRTTFFSQTQAITVANSVVETAITGTGIGSLVIPANSLAVGDTFYLRAFGFHSAAGNPNFTINIKLDGVTALTTGAQSSGNSTNTAWELRAMMTVFASGVGGTQWSQGFYNETGGGAGLFGLTNTSSASFDTTQQHTVSVTFQWGTASTSDTITITNLFIGKNV